MPYDHFRPEMAFIINFNATPRGPQLRQPTTPCMQSTSPHHRPLPLFRFQPPPMHVATHARLCEVCKRLTCMPLLNIPPANQSSTLVVSAYRHVLNSPPPLRHYTRALASKHTRPKSLASPAPLQFIHLKNTMLTTIKTLFPTSCRAPP